MILLDTQVTVWLTTDKQKISSAAANAIREASRSGVGVAIASSTLWEIAMMSARKRIRLPTTLAGYLGHVESAFVVLPITGVIAERSILFPESFPRDPTDRLIAATALIHRRSLITADEAIRRSGELECVW